MGERREGEGDTLKAEMQLTMLEMGFTTAWVVGTSKIDRGLKLNR